jgi:hypothetical protein
MVVGRGPVRAGDGADDTASGNECKTRNAICIGFAALASASGLWW